MHVRLPLARSLELEPRHSLATTATTATTIVIAMASYMVQMAVLLGTGLTMAMAWAAQMPAK